MKAFPPGLEFKIPLLPNVTVVNELGDYDIAADRLAFIDGEGPFSLLLLSLWEPALNVECAIVVVDPWRPDTPQSSYYAKPRPDTLLRPVKLIPSKPSFVSAEAVIRF